MKLIISSGTLTLDCRTDSKEHNFDHGSTAEDVLQVSLRGSKFAREWYVIILKGAELLFTNNTIIHALVGLFPRRLPAMGSILYGVPEVFGASWQTTSSLASAGSKLSMQRSHFYTALSITGMPLCLSLLPPPKW